MIRSGKKYIFIFLFFIIMDMTGQNTSPDFSDFNFVKYSENYIHFYNQNSNFYSFFKKLDTLLIRHKGKVNIMQMGGSHIQAEIWPDRMRKNFLDLADSINGGRGFVFPFKIAKTWNPKNFQIAYTGDWKAYRNSVKKHKAKWGLSGITVETLDSLATFSIGYKSDTLTNYRFDRIRIFHSSNPDYQVELLSEKPVRTRIDKKIGFTEFLLAKETDTLSVGIKKTGKSNVPFSLYGLSLENDRPGIVYTSVGVNGAKTDSYLRNELFTDQLSVVNPDLVIFCIGINDAYNPNFCASCYEENYQKLVDKIRTVNPKAEFLFVTNNDSYYKRKYPNKNVLKAREVMEQLAKKNNAGLWDLFEVMGGLGSVKNWEEQGFAKKDKIHFTDKGYDLLGDLMFSALMKAYDQYKKQE